MVHQKLGQHFLSNTAWRKRIADTLPASPDSVWIEIGAGHGEMTEFLAQRARRVIAIETDATLAAALRNRAAKSSSGAGWPNVELMHSDILAVDLALLVQSVATVDLRQGTASAVPTSSVTRGASAPEASLKLAESQREMNATQHFRMPPRSAETFKSVVTPNPGRGLTGVRNLLFPSAQPGEMNATQHFRVYGNLPYYITSPILTHLFRFAAHIDSIHIVTQLEVAQRIAALPGSRDYGYLSTLCQYYTRPELLFRIPPGAFNPPPKVTSSLLEMHLPGERAALGIQNDAAFLKFLQTCFAQKRKTLRNNLRDTYAHGAIAKALTAAALTEKSRAEELALRQFAQIFKVLNAEENPTSAPQPAR